MKTIKTLLTVAVAGVVFSACNDLNQSPNYGVVTEAQKKQVIEDNPSMAAASVNALPTGTCSRFAIYGGSPRLDTDFGVPSLFMIMDSRGMDMPSDLSDYQWYTAALTMNDFGGLYYDNILFWRTWYNLINSCNSVTGLISADTENGESQYYRAQALGFRAWSYLNLAQMYQFTYAHNPQAPTVPLLLDTNLEEAAANGSVRATGEAIYAQILADFNEAIALLDKAEAQGYTREKVAAGNTTKTFMNQAIMYGLKTRVDLLIQNYDDAISDVNKAISLAKAAGARCYTYEEAGKPILSDISEAPILWGFYVDPNSSLVGLISWGGQMIPWHTGGYPAVGCYRKINKALYNSVSSADVRKGWWLNESGSAGNSLPSDYREYMSTLVANGGVAMPPYCGIKFSAYNNEPGGTTNAEDVCYMRMEELYLMLAEAKGMKNPSEGAQELANFVKTYRMPTYSLNVSSKEDFIDALWFQRRIELWGEGFSYFDMMRFEKPLNRVGGGFDATLVYQVQPNDPVLIYEIIQSEAENNPLIGVVSNGAVKPDAVPDVE
jgi:hypothetical protein